MPQSKSKGNTTRRKKATGSIEKKSAPESFPFVGLGASAGGSEALKASFTKVPPTSDMAFVVLVHMTPNQPGLLPELLQNISLIPVSAAKDGDPLEPDSAYIISLNKDLSVYNGKIQLLDRTTNGGLLPIDFFFRSLAQDQGSNAAAIVLSGMGKTVRWALKRSKLMTGLYLFNPRNRPNMTICPAVHSIPELLI